MENMISETLAYLIIFSPYFVDENLCLQLVVEIDVLAI